MQKVVVVGGGPAGLFAAHKLGSTFDLTLIDKGKEIKNRHCPKGDGECVRCRMCQISHGLGGAGLFSDGKLLYHTMTGNNLSEVIGARKNQGLVDEVEAIFNRYNIETDAFDISEHHGMITKAAQFGIKYMPSKQAHVGSDKLPGTLDNMVNDLKQHINVAVNEEVKDIDAEKKEVITDKSIYEYDYLILAPGRAGSEWLQQIIDKHKIKYDYQPLDIGVRVEIPSSIMRPLTELNWDFKARMRTKTYNDIVRTFCVCPYGFVTIEKYDSFSLVNGHSEKDRKSDSTNFAFLVTYKLTEPIQDGNAYGRTIAEKATYIGGGKPILQRLGDLRGGQRSTWHRIEKDIMIEPTLTDVTPGDIGSAMEYRFVKDIIEGLGNLNNLIPGVANDSTLLYAPEIKFLGIRAKTDEFLQTNIPGIYVAGDGAGFSRGIVGAAASGLLAANGILRK